LANLLRALRPTRGFPKPQQPFRAVQAILLGTGYGSYGWATPGWLALMIIEKLALAAMRTATGQHSPEAPLRGPWARWARHHWRCRLNKAHELTAINGDMS